VFDILVGITDHEFFLTQHAPDMYISTLEIPFKYYPRNQTFRSLRKTLALERGLEEERVRLWNWIRRKNKTTRVELPVLLDDKLEENLEKIQSPDFLLLFLEVLEPGRPYSLNSDAEMIVFFKYFNVEKGQVDYVGYGVFNRSDLIIQVRNRAAKIMGFDEKGEEGIELFEEVRPFRIDTMSLDQTLQGSEIVSGDILIITPRKETVPNWDDLPIKGPLELPKHFSLYTVEWKVDELPFSGTEIFPSVFGVQPWFWQKEPPVQTAEEALKGYLGKRLGWPEEGIEIEEGKEKNVLCHAVGQHYECSFTGGAYIKGGFE
jgi:hypothetical protein